MTTTNTPFPSTLFNLVTVLRDTEEGKLHGDQTPVPEHCGYTLINDCLVPETFIQLVARQIEKAPLAQYGDVLSKEDIFDSEFLTSLRKTELSFLMPVVLQLVARDKFPANLWAACPENYETPID